MKKSEVWSILVLALICAAVLIGVFIGRVTSGDRIYVQKQEDITQPTEEHSSAKGPIDINTADAELLAYIPGIGDVLAKRIIQYREKNGPFTDVRELLNVSGIGEAKLEKIKDYIRIGD